MLYLLLVSLVWAFSFGLIKSELTGLDANFVSFTRCFLAFLFFLPVTKNLKNISKELFFRLLIIGGIQFGLMYVFYTASFKYLKSYEVAVFTILTPVYIAIFDYRAEKIFLFAVLSVLGAAIIVYKPVSSSALFYGFLLVQISNLCFAYGQLQYKKIVSRFNIGREYSVFSIMYLGACASAFLPYAISPNLNFAYWKALRAGQILTLIYLGLIASGICFFLWNSGAVKTDNRRLAVMNNLKIPLAVIASVLLFKESTDYARLALGTVILCMALIFRKRGKWTAKTIKK
jgi:drug/metabolite transporter (DMT)-like permease